MKIYFGLLIFITFTKDSRQMLSCSPHDDGLELISEGMAAYQSSTNQIERYNISLTADLAVDGYTTTYSRRLCSESESNWSSWWYVDLGQTSIVSSIFVYMRYGHAYKLDKAIVRVGNDSSAPFIGNVQCGYNLSSVIANGHNPVNLTCNPAITGKYVSVYLPTSEHLRLCEVQVFTDIKSPVVTCPANITFSSTIVTWDYAEVTDNLDTDLPLTCTPPSGSSFAVGSTDVNCSATDAAGNTGSCMFTVSITDIKSPVVTCPANITFSSTIVTWDYAEVTDNLDTDLPLTCTPPSGSSFAVGSTDVNCSATDAAGNTGSCNSKLTDTTSTSVSTSTIFSTSTIGIISFVVISVLLLFACLIFYRFHTNQANKHKLLGAMIKTVANKVDSYDTQPKERERPDSAGIDNIYDFIIEQGATAKPEAYEIPALTQELYITPI
ncbi:sushi, von Willebrand factor type A, EGF and pentraxin domain-containing protein 1-like isoform X2 [Anneissia japonica]|uniref:sushi, von Willebrand factor type A, EGF and pentraxin domain-containing protein 1-like isoform X2 n=1 Tax=Anneissia japonica TaxID=1529436 RepID=UPI0014258DAD|nr:sushi, von Willebrand factor type A, EGF and pentraxin domain-containing protein 1-like isoform X2 [Anneissia japonica]